MPFTGRTVKMSKFVQKVVGICTLIVFITANAVLNADIIRADKFKGLARNPSADKIEDGAHSQFDNVYLKYGNLQVVKGRDRLNSTAHADAVVNGQWYYENQAGTTKKIVVAESDELVTYDIDGTNRTQIANTLTNEKWDAKKFGDVLYLTSSTNGIYKWTGTGSATALGSVSTPSSVDFTPASSAGGMTPGNHALVAHTINSSAGEYWYQGGTCSKDIVRVADYQEDNIACTSLSGSFIKTCATSTVYKYKITSFSSTTGLESEASSSDDASLTGDNTVSVAGRVCFPVYSDAACTSFSRSDCGDTEIIIAGRQTSTTGTLASAPSAPYDTYRVYRTTAGGSDYFLDGQQSTGTYVDGKPDLSLSTALDTTIDTIAPPSFRYIEEYKGAIFVAEGDTIKYSHIPTTLVTDADKYWLDTDELQVPGVITGLIKAADSLLIFTRDSIYQLTGFGASSFRLIPVIQGVGAITDETIRVDTNGDVIFFSGTSGVFKIHVGQQPIDSLNGSIIDQSKGVLVKLSSVSMDSVFRGDDTQIVLTTSDYTTSHGYYDEDNELYWLYIGSHAFIFDQVNEAWTHIPATNMISSVWLKSPGSVGVGVLIDNAGFFFNNWTGYENGIESGTVTGNPTSSTNTTLVCSTCTFNTTGDGLKGLWIFVDNENDEYRQVTSNTATTITVSSAWTTNPITTDDFYVAHIIPVWQTKQYSFIRPPDESSMTIFYLMHNLPATSQELEVYAYMDKETTPTIDAFTIDLLDKRIHAVNTRMRSSWMEWKFRAFVYNISSSVISPIDITSYAFDAEAEKKVNNNG